MAYTNSSKLSFTHKIRQNHNTKTSQDSTTHKWKVEFFQKRYNLDVGDIIVIVSDGVIDSKRNVINKEFWVSSFLRELDITDPKIIAEELLEKTIDNYNGDIKDDISIIVTKISE